MRKLTFEGFLKQYVAELSGVQTASAHKLADHMAENHKTTYITLYGVEKAREMVRRLVLEADLAVKGTMLDDEMLYELADTLAKRNH